jgi:hypothetical protein
MKPIGACEVETHSHAFYHFVTIELLTVNWDWVRFTYKISPYTLGYKNETRS